MNTQSARKLYRLIGRYVEGADTVGYQLVDYMGNRLSLRKEEVERLANDRVIENCRLIIYNNKTYLKGSGIRLSELPIIDARTGEIRGLGKKSESGFYITNRLMNKTTVIGYIVRDANGKPYRISRGKVWQLARDKAINNAVAQVCSGQKVLRGVGIQLGSLPVIQV